MIIYINSLKEVLKSKSTWIILFISCWCISFFIPFLSFYLSDKTSTYFNENYALVSSIQVPIVISALMFLGFVFIGFKTAEIIKDDQENGSLLLLIAKPISRLKIIFYKILALNTMLFLYAFLNITFLIIAISIFDVKEVLSHQITRYGFGPLKNHIFIIWGWGIIILYVTLFAFSSLIMFFLIKKSSAIIKGGSITIAILIQILNVTNLISNNDLNNNSKNFSNEIVPSFNQDINFYQRSIKDLDASNELKNLYQHNFNKFSLLTDDPTSIFNIKVKNRYFESDWTKYIDYINPNNQLLTMTNFITNKYVNFRQQKYLEQEFPRNINGFWKFFNAKTIIDKKNAFNNIVGNDLEILKSKKKVLDKMLSKTLKTFAPLRLYFFNLYWKKIRNKVKNISNTNIYLNKEHLEQVIKSIEDVAIFKNLKNQLEKDWKTSQSFYVKINTSFLKELITFFEANFLEFKNGVYQFKNGEINNNFYIFYKYLKKGSFLKTIEFLYSAYFNNNIEISLDYKIRQIVFQPLNYFYTNGIVDHFVKSNSIVYIKNINKNLFLLNDNAINNEKPIINKFFESKEMQINNEIIFDSDVMQYYHFLGLIIDESKYIHKINIKSKLNKNYILLIYSLAGCLFVSLTIARFLKMDFK